MEMVGRWDLFWPDGNVVVTNSGVGAILPDGSLRMKFLWLLAGDGPLTVVGRRLDGSSRPLQTTIPEGFIGKGFQPSHLIFQSAGCWEITATANGSAMSFVTKVTRGRVARAIRVPEPVPEQGQPEPFTYKPDIPPRAIPKVCVTEPLAEADSTFVGIPA